MPPRSTRNLTVDAILQNSNITYRQLDCWCNFGIFGKVNRSPGYGKNRRFDVDDMLVAQVLGTVTKDMSIGLGIKGVDMSTLSLIADAVRQDQRSIELIATEGTKLVLSWKV